MMRSQNASGTDSTVPREMSAALLTSTSMPPNSLDRVAMTALAVVGVDQVAAR